MLRLVWQPRMIWHKIQATYESAIEMGRFRWDNRSRAVLKEQRTHLSFIPPDEAAMLTLSKKTDYALIALSYLAERPDKVASAREIAEAYNLPLALLMNILKLLHHRKLLRSTRGTKGGYQLLVSPDSLSLHDLVEMIDGPMHLTECVLLAKTCHTPKECEDQRRCKVNGCPVTVSMRALHAKLEKFLREVRVSDVIVPGRRIDVPLELVAAEA